MLILLHTKNFSLVDDLTVPDTQGVPRVGEFIVLPPELSEQVQGLTHALMHEVEWLLQGPPKARALTAMVSCHATGYDPSNRLVRLEENGWLQPRN